MAHEKRDELLAVVPEEHCEFVRAAGALQQSVLLEHLNKGYKIKSVSRDGSVLIKRGYADLWVYKDGRVDTPEI